MKLAAGKLRPFIKGLFGAAQQRAEPAAPSGMPPIDDTLVGLRDAVESGW